MTKQEYEQKCAELEERRWWVKLCDDYASYRQGMLQIQREQWELDREYNGVSS